jgi:predicted kinase
MGRDPGGGDLIALVGPPGAGKTTLRAAWPEAVVASLDDNRRWVSPCGCSSNQDPTVCALAVQIAYNTARAALAAGHTVLWDATNAGPADRRALVVLAAEMGARCRAVVLLPPLPVCLARNARRSTQPCCCGYTRRVPDAVVEEIHHAITHDLSALLAEGWHDIDTTRTT